MDIPPGYSITSGTNEVCKLQRALYGLKLSPRAWFGRFSLAMKKYGLTQSNSNHTLFLKKQRGKTTTLIIYVDDMIITGDDKEEMSPLQGKLTKNFEMECRTHKNDLVCGVVTTFPQCGGNSMWRGLIFIFVKRESPPSIMVTRKPKLVFQRF